MTTDRLATRLRSRLAAVMALIAAVVAAGGCAKPLFPEDTPRSPYERYQKLRGQARPETEPDAFGVDRPALRERLKPLGQP